MPTDLDLTQTRGTEASSHTGIGVSHPLNRLWERWKRTARKVADVQARLLLTIFYFVFLCPFALLVKWFGDPLMLKRTEPPQWVNSTSSSETHLDRAKRQF